MNIAERRAKAATLIADAQALLKKGSEENRDSTPEERDTAKSKMDEAKNLQEQADLEERAAKMAADLQASTPSTTRLTEPPTPTSENRTRPVITAVYSTPKNFRSINFGTVESARNAAIRSGHWAMAVLFGNERSTEFCRDNGIPIIRAISGSTNAKGGYLVPHELETSIVALMDEYGIARPNCRVVRMTTDTKDIPIRLTGLTAYPIGEAQEVPESDKTWGLASMIARKWGVLVRYSSEVSEDAIIGIADDLAMETSLAFSYSEDNCLINGDGTGTFHGITGVLNALLAGSIKACAATHTTFAKVDDADITTAFSYLPQYALRGSKIFVHPQVGGQVFERLLRGAGGNTKADLASGQGPSYNGYPIVKSTLLNATDGTSKVIAVIGNMAMATVFGDRRAMTMRSSDQRYLELDQTAILATERFDIKVHATGTATVAGPLVILKTAAS